MISAFSKQTNKQTRVPNIIAKTLKKEMVFSLSSLVNCSPMLGRVINYVLKVPQQTAQRTAFCHIGTHNREAWPVSTIKI